MTIHEIAKRLGVAAGTVSKALNGTGSVSPALREKIRREAAKLGYTPLDAAVNLRLRRTRTIGLILICGRSVFSTLLEKADQAAAQRDYSLIVRTLDGTPWNTSQEEDAIEMMLRRNVEGLILMPLSDKKELYERVRVKGIPLVMVERDCPGGNFCSVINDNFGAAAEAGRYLLAHGHRRILVLTQWPDGRMDEVESLRFNGLKSSFEGVAGSALFPVYCHALDDRPLEFIRQNDITAVFSVSDLGAALFADVVQRRGIRIPEELSILCFDNNRYLEARTPRITCVEQPMEEMARRAVESVFQELEHPGSLSAKKNHSALSSY